MTTAEDERAGRARRYARAQQQQRRREQQVEPEVEHPAELEATADPADPAVHRDTGVTRTPDGTHRQVVTRLHCPACYGPLPRAPRLRQDARCQECRQPPRRKTKREQIEYVTDAWPQ